MESETTTQALFPRMWHVARVDMYPWGQLIGPQLLCDTWGPLPSCTTTVNSWGWAPAFATTLLSWLSKLKWPGGLGEVTYVELALDYEGFSGQCLPSTPNSRLCGLALPLSERARVMRVALTKLARLVQVQLFPAKLMQRSTALWALWIKCTA